MDSPQLDPTLSWEPFVRTGLLRPYASFEAWDAPVANSSMCAHTSFSNTNHLHLTVRLVLRTLHHKSSSLMANRTDSNAHTITTFITALITVKIVSRAFYKAMCLNCSDMLSVPITNPTVRVCQLCSLCQSIQVSNRAVARVCRCTNVVRR